MNRIAVFLLALSATLFAQLPAQNAGTDFGESVQILFGDLNPAEITTGRLYDRVVPLSGIERYSGILPAPPLDARKWKQLYFEMFRSSLNPSPLPDLQELASRADARVRSGVIPIALLDLRFNSLKDDAVDRGLVEIRGGRFADVTDRTESPYETRRVFAAVSLKSHSYYTSVTFGIEEEFLFSEESSGRIEIDFGDGLGFRSVSRNATVQASYQSAGVRTITVRSTSSSGVVSSSFLFEIRRIKGLPAETMAPDIFWENQTATRSYLGVFAGYDGYIFLGTGNTEVTRPIIFVEGFDLDNSYGWEEIYDLLNTENLAGTLQDAGFDLILLNFHEGTDYLQRNSFALVSLIEQVLAARSGEANLLIAGASMGGLIGRHTLAWMETNGIDHETDLFLSFDSPHQGANIPLGLQHWVEFFSEHDGTANEFLGRLNAPGAQQMLVYHHTTGTAVNPLRATFLSELAALGDYPSGLQLAAIANGSGAGPGGGQKGNGGVPMLPGAQIVDYEYFSFFVDIIGNCWAVPEGSPNTMIFEGRVDQIWPLPDDALSVFIAGTDPHDNAPGGLRASMQELADIEVDYGDITTAFPDHSFIPSVSALDLRNSDQTPVNLFHDINGDPGLLEKTPFESIYLPSSTENEEHVTITAANAAFILNLVMTGQPPVLADIPDQTVQSGQRFLPIRADILVSDPDHPDSLLTWSWSGETELVVRWHPVKRGFKVQAPAGWTGSETMTFTVTDPDGLSDSDAATFTVEPAETGMPIAGDGTALQSAPTEMMLFDNYPNPFNPSTEIRYQLPVLSNVRLDIFNTLGERVALLVDGVQGPGSHTATWSGSRSSGLYFYRLEAVALDGSGERYSAIRKMLLVK